MLAAAVLRDQLRAAMAANIKERAHRSFLVTGQQNRLAEHVAAQEGPASGSSLECAAAWGWTRKMRSRSCSKRSDDR